LTNAIHEPLLRAGGGVYLFSSTCLANVIHEPLLHTGGGEEGRGRGGGQIKKRKSAAGVESKKRKSADGGESKALRKRQKTKHRTVARQFALCWWKWQVQ